MKLSLGFCALSATVAGQNQTSPDITFVGNDIRWTQDQIDYFKSKGIDTEGMKVTPLTNDEPNRHVGLQGKAVINPNHSYHHRWKNPEGFSGPHLRVPYRFASGQFTSTEQQTIRDSLDSMGKLVLDCIEFYDDTTTQLYAKGYVRFQSSSGGCWAQAGFVGHHPSYSTHQPINLSKSGCIHPMIINHEMLHAVAMLHEQSRPDRDDYIIVHYDAIQSSYHSQYRKMDVGDWEDVKVKYDYWSVMHYPSYGFATGSKPTMTHIETGEPVQKPRRTRVSTLDMIQLQKMYSEFCPNQLPTATCDNGKDVYLLPFACDGIPDCTDGSDEIESACDQMCADKLLVTTGATNEIDAAGVYAFKGNMLNSKYVYEHESKLWFLYSNAENNNWHINPVSGDNSAHYYSTESTCPYGKSRTWFKFDGSWVEYPELEVTLWEQIDFCSRDKPCDELYETCENGIMEATCTFKKDSCPVEGDFDTMEDCVAAICPTVLTVAANTEPITDEEILGTYKYQGIENKRPGYKRKNGNKYAKGDEWIIYDFAEQKWTISGVISNDVDSAFNETFVEHLYQNSEQLCPSTFNPSTGSWMKSSNDKPVGTDFTIGNGKTACDEGTHNCQDDELCVADLGTIEYSCVANPCHADACPGLGMTCTFNAQECPPDVGDVNEIAKVWHGEKDIATWEFIGGYRSYHGDENAMFDNVYDDRHMYHSSTCSEERGIVITFNSPVKYTDLQIFTRSHCCRDRYASVCLYADNVKIACTPDNQGDPGKTVNFKDHSVIDATKEVKATVFKLMWERDASDDCAQVEELFFHYVETQSGITPSRGRKLGTIGEWGEQFNLQFNVRVNEELETATNLMYLTAFDEALNKAVRIPQINVDKNSKKLRVGTYINGETKWVDVDLGKDGYGKVSIQQNFNMDGNPLFEIQLNGDTKFSEVNLNATVYKDVQVYASSPWQAAASHALLRNIVTSTPMKPCGHTCEFSKEDCPTAAVTWKGTKAGVVTYGSDGALQLKMTIVNNKKPIDIRKNKYTGFMMFSKSKCGEDFLKATVDGRVHFQIYDKGIQPANMYEINHVYYRDGNKPTATVQFRQRKKSQSPPADLPPKNIKKDQFFLTITGLDEVKDIPSYTQCFGKGGILLGVMEDKEADAGKKDWTQCVAYQKPRN